MPTPKQLRAMRLYADIMEEIKLRISAIDSGTGGLLIALPPPIVREHCYLQLRMICELIALACLVAHGDIKGTQMPKFQKQWAADKIMEDLEKLNPHFYPQSAKISQDSVDAFHPVPFPKSELLSLYYKCGDILHRGSAKKLLSQTKPTIIRYADITAIAQKIVDLLSVHLVAVVGTDTVFVCVLRNSLDGGRVQVAIGGRGAPP